MSARLRASKTAPTTVRMVSRLLPAAGGASGGPLSVSFTSAIVSPEEDEAQREREGNRVSSGTQQYRTLIKIK
jgi:hypothetical protein